MEQMKFIFMSNKMNPISVSDDGNGKIIVELRKGVQVIHNYKKNNRMEIVFTDSQDHYEIPSQNELESLYQIHLGNTNFIAPATEYCENNLRKI